MSYSDWLKDAMVAGYKGRPQPLFDAVLASAKQYSDAASANASQVADIATKFGDLDTAVDVIVGSTTQIANQAAAAVLTAQAARDASQAFTNASGAQAVQSAGSAAAAAASAAAASQAQSAGVVGFALLSTLNANLNYPDKTVAWVLSDPTPANNTSYIKSGASGTGSWTVATGDRVTPLEQKVGRNWRSASAVLLATVNDQAIASGILSIVANGFTSAEQARNFQMTVLARDDTTYADRIAINDDVTSTWAFIGTAANKTTGPVWVKATNASSGGYFDILIDYRAFATGVLLNSTANKFLLSKSIFGQSKLDVRMSGLEFRTPYAWLSKAATAVPGVSADQTLLDAILSVQAAGFIEAERTHAYQISVIANGDATYVDRVQINDDAGNAWAFSGTATNKANGPTWLKLVHAGATSYFNVLLDYRALSAGLPMNSTSNKLLLSPSIFAAGQINIRLDTLESAPAPSSSPAWRSSAAAAAVGTLQTQGVSAVLAVRGRAIDPTKQYHVVVFGNSDPTYSDNLIIQDKANANSAWSFLGTVANKANGPVWVKLPQTGSSGATGYFEMLIDYRLITSPGMAYNASGDVFLFSSLVYVEEPLNTRITTLEGASGSSFPAWRNSTATALVGNQTQVVPAILSVRGRNVDHTNQYRITIFCNNDPTYKDRIWIQDKATGTLKWTLEGTVANKTTGPVWVTATSASGPATFDLLIDYRTVTATGILYNAAADGLLFSSMIYVDDPLLVRIAAGSSSSGAAPVNVAQRALRVSVAGSSITWGNGWLGEDSYAGAVEDWLRNSQATTLHAATNAAIAVVGSSSAVTGKDHYKGSTLKMSGVGTTASFSLTGDELSLVIARERGNAGAAVIELYIAGVLYDTFSTFNAQPFATGKVKNFVGDGATAKFDLGECWTYNHAVTVGGTAKIGSLNAGGYGGTVPSTDDFMVIRQLVAAAGGPEVHHFLLFKVAPATTAAIACTYDAGESVTHMRGTVGNIGKSLSTSLESAYGDGNVSFDPAHPSAISSGLGFRESDTRAVVTWRFDTAVSRAFMLNIKSLDSRATGATPELWLNFATNRMHHLQNAGIGGWSASLLRDDTGLNNVKYINRFQPDAVLLESCTNDDWNTHVDHAWRSRTGLTDAQVRNDDSGNYFKTVTYVSADNYTVDDNRMSITAITDTSATLDGTGATFQVATGDAFIIGDFKGDNRRVVTRIVSAWDATNRIVSWGKPLRTEELAQIKALNDLVGGYAMVKAAPIWRQALIDVITSLRVANPDVQVILGTGGIPNWHYRRLEGYRELANQLATEQGALFTDYYRQTLKWTYSRPADMQLYLDAAKSTTSTGASTYPLYNAAGVQPDPVLYSLLRILSVKVDGIERLNDGCYVAGGTKNGWLAGVTPMTKANIVVTASSPYQLVFTNNPPAASSQIVVGYASVKWSNDDTHPGTQGISLFGQAAVGATNVAVGRALGKASVRL